MHKMTTHYVERIIGKERKKEEEVNLELIKRIADISK